MPPPLPPPVPPKPTNIAPSEGKPASTVVAEVQSKAAPASTTVPKAPEAPSHTESTSTAVAKAPAVPAPDADTASEDDSIEEFNPSASEFQNPNPGAVARRPGVLQMVGRIGLKDLPTIAKMLTPKWLKGWFNNLTSLKQTLGAVKNMVKAKLFGPSRPMLPAPAEHVAATAQTAGHAPGGMPPASGPGAGAAPPRRVLGLPDIPHEPAVENDVIPQPTVASEAASESGTTGSKKGKHKKPKKESNPPSNDNNPINSIGPEPLLSPEIVAALTAALAAKNQNMQQAPVALEHKAPNAEIGLSGVEPLVKGRPPVALPPAFETSRNRAPQPETVTGTPYVDLTKMIDYLTNVRDNSDPPLLLHDTAEGNANTQRQHVSNDASPKEHKAIAPAKASDDHKDLPVPPHNPTGSGNSGPGGSGGAALPNPGGDPDSEGAGAALEPVGPLVGINKGLGLALGALGAVVGAAGTYWVSDKIINWWKNKKKAKEQQQEAKVSRRHARDWTVAVDY